MTSVGELLDELAQVLAGDGVPPDRGGARDLIAAVLEKPRFWPTGHRDLTLDEAQLRTAKGAAASIRSGVPFPNSERRRG